MTEPRRVCLVADELYPFTHGGIGRLLHNLIRSTQRRADNIEFHFLSPERVGLSQTGLDAVFGSPVRLHRYGFSPLDTETRWNDGIYPPSAAHTNWHGESLAIALQLRELEQSGLCFDEIEFPDFRGLAFYSLQEKRLGRCFQRARVGVRLHSTHGVLYHFDADPLSFEDLAVRELERKALFDADLVIAHLPAIADFNRRFYGFDRAWLSKVSIEFPPVLESIPPEAGLSRPAQRPLVFASRTNVFKRVDLFIRGSAAFMRASPDFAGDAVLACHVFHERALGELLAELPSDLRQRFRVVAAEGAVREGLLANGIIVIPSDYESLSLLAYEASAAGGALVLNGRCLAFGPDTPFVEGVNCRKFDGSVDDLVRALRLAHEGPPLGQVEWQATPPYWERPRVVPVSSRSAPGRVSVVIVNRNQGAALVDTVASLAASDQVDVEVIVVDDASTASIDTVVLARLESERGSSTMVKVSRHDVRRGFAASRNAGFRLATGDFVLFANPGDAVVPGFLSAASGALARHQEFAGVAPTVGYFERPEDLPARRLSGFATQLGDALTQSVVANGSSLHPLWRRDALPDNPFHEVLDRDGAWTPYLQSIFEGARFLVTPEIAYLAWSGGAPPGLDHAHRQALVARLVGAGDEESGRATELAAFLLSIPIARDHSAAHAQSDDSQPPPLRYEIVDRLNAGVKALRVLHPILRRAAQMMNRPQRGS